MDNYKYEELSSIIAEVLSDFKFSMESIGQNMTQTLERFFNDFGNVMDEGQCEATIVCSTICIELGKIGEKTIASNHFDKLMKVLSDYNKTNISYGLTDIELQDLDERVREAIGILNELEKL